jgi:hypothetical protein
MYKQLNQSLLLGLFLSLISFSCSESPKPATAITISDTDFAATQKPNTSVKYIDFEKEKFSTAPTEGENQTWDFSAYKSSSATPRTINYLTPRANTSFKTATYGLKYVSRALGLNLNITNHYEISSTGFYNLGGQIEQTSSSLGNGIVLSTVDNENAWTPKVLLWKFPMVYKDSYNSESSIKESFRLTAPPFGLTNAPTDRINTSQQQAQIVGWGKLILPTDGKVVTSEALLFKLTTTSTFTYLLNNNPAPAVLLGGLGLTQGEKVTRVTYYFFSKNSGDIAVITFDTDGTGKLKLPAVSSYYLTK